MDQEKRPAKCKVMILPPPDGHCRICGVKHEPYLAHNAESVFYGVRFKLRYGREGTWEDAIAHCSDEDKESWRRLTQEMGIGWTSPPEGVEPIAEPIDS